jgi:hypothetical protein
MKLKIPVTQKYSKEIDQKLLILLDELKKEVEERLDVGAKVDTESNYKIEYEMINKSSFSIPEHEYTGNIFIDLEIKMFDPNLIRRKV